MKMLNDSEEKAKQQDIKELKEQRESILSATRPDILNQRISLLEAILILMRKKYEGEIANTLNRTFEEINGFKMHDKTRKDVARMVQTLISELNQQ